MLIASRKIRSSKKNPCPVCGRVKDGDCMWDGELFFCHTFIDRDPEIPDYNYRKATQCGTWGMFVEQKNKGDREMKPIRDAGEISYIYTSGNAPLVKVVRKDKGDGNKFFYQCRYENGRWVPGLNSEVKQQLHLYKINHPINQKAIANGDPTLIVEGEGKVDALLDLGISSVCCIGGAGKWKQYGYPNYLTDLQGAFIVLCPDRDLKGVQHCEDIAQDINGAAWMYAFPDSPEWTNLPKNGGLDVRDWILQGATKEQIIAAIGVKKFQLRSNPHPWRDCNNRNLRSLITVILPEMPN